MEADWEVEIGPSAAVIEGSWAGFIDLIESPERIGEIEEAQDFVTLEQALLQLNSTDATVLGKMGLVWTSKCDVWSVEQCDPYEFDCAEADAMNGLACYIDLLPRVGMVFADVPEAERWAREAVSRLRRALLGQCRVDLVIRRAFVGSLEGLGVTAYVAGCGNNPIAARVALEAALEVFVQALAATDADL